MLTRSYARTIVLASVLALVALTATPAHAQTCEGDITLTSQAEVDAFNCATVVGFVSVTGADITNLDGLSELTQVGSFLHINNNPELTSLAGLSALTSVDQLAIEDNPKLTSTAGLGALTSIGQSLFIKRNAQLSTLNGLSGLTTVGGGPFFAIEDNPKLTSLNGLQALTSVGTGDFIIQNNATLRTCDQGLRGLASGNPLAFAGITGTITIASNAAAGSCNTPQDVLDRIAASILSVTATDDLFESQVELRWSSYASNRLFFRIERDGTLLAVAGNNQATYLDTTGDPGTTYTYCVTAVENGVDVLTACDTGSRKVFAPTGARATDSTLETEVLFTWTDRSEVETAYVLTRDGAALATLPANTVTYSDISAVAGTTYTYCVSAENADGFASEARCDDGTRAFVTPPTDVAATDGQFPHSVRITWSDPTSTEDLFTIYRYLGPDTSAVTPDLLGTVPADSTLFDDDPGVDELGDGQVYTYCVTSTTGSSESIKVCDEGRAGGLTPPADVAASVDTFDDRVQITWTDAADTEDAFRIARDGTILDTLAAGTERYNDFTAVQGTDYEYCVQAFSELDPDMPSMSLSGCDTGRRSTVLPPANVAASDDDFEEHVEIVWQNVSTTVMLFNIYRVENGDTTLIHAISPALPRVFDEEVASDMPHDYCVAAVTVPGASSALQSQVEQLVAQVAMQEQIEAASGTLVLRESGMTAQRLLARVETLATSEGTPLLRSMNASTTIVESAKVCDIGSRSIAPPTGVTATYDSYEDRVQVSWSNSSSVQTGFVIYRHTEAEPTPVVVDNVGPNRASLGDYTGVPGVAYTYSVTAIDAFGESEAATDRGRRVLLAPTALQASDGTSEMEVRLTWIDNARAEDGYRIYRRATSASDSTQIDITAASATSYTDVLDAADLGVDFIYSVVAFDAYGESAPATDAGGTSILAPTAFSASTSYEDQITLTWVNNSAINDGYQFYRNGDSLATLSDPSATVFVDRDLALTFDGEDDEVLISGPLGDTDPVLLPSAGFTIEFWAKRNTTGTPAYIVSHGVEAPNQGLHIGFANSSSAFAFNFFSNDLYTESIYTDTDWHHWAVTYDDASKERYIYRDGLVVAADVASAPYSGSGILRLGSQFGRKNFLDGQLDELRIWEGARTPEEIAATMETRLSGNETNLFGYWPFLEGMGTETADLAGDNDGTLVGGLAWDTALNVFAELDPGASYDYCIAAVANDIPSEQVCRRGRLTTTVDITADVGQVPDFIMPKELNTGDLFGYSVSTSGQYAIVGAIYHNEFGGTLRRGGAWVYKRVADGWDKQVRLTSTVINNTESAQFGWKVRIQGDHAFVSAISDDNSEGRVLLFTRQGEDWGTNCTGDLGTTRVCTENEVIAAAMRDKSDFFGHGLAVSGDYLLVGSIGDDGVDNIVVTSMGAAFIYQRDGDIWGDCSGTTCTEFLRLEQSTPVESDGFASRVAIDGDNALIAVDRENALTGAVYLYKREGTEWGNCTGTTCTENLKLVASDGQPGDRFGFAPSIRGDYAIIGGYVFKREGDTWGNCSGTTCTETSKLPTPDGLPTPGGLSAIAGNYAVINAGSGSVYVYRLQPKEVNGEPEWTHIGIIEPDVILGETADATGFGGRVSIAPDGTILISADNFGSDVTGAVYTTNVLVKPSAVTVSDGSSPDRVQVQWGDESPYETGYRIYRRTSEDAFELVGTTGANSTEFNDFGAAPGEAYEYCVHAYSDELANDFGPTMGESLATCGTGWRPPNGSMAGRVASLGGGGTEDVQLCLSDPNPNRALYFDGIGGEVVITGPMNSDVQLPHEDKEKAGFTIEFWAKRAAIGTNEYVLSQGVEAVNQGLHIGFQAENNFRFSFWGNDLDTPEYTDTDWHHWAVTYDATTLDRKIYRDGTEVASDTAPSKYAGSGPLYLGTLDYFDRTANFFGGQIDELRIWEGVRSSDAINRTMFTSLNGDEIGLFGYWAFDQRERNVVPDRSGNGYNGVIRGNADWAAEGAFPVCATTDSAGNFVISGINYGKETSLTLTPSRENRAFDPPFSKITLSTDNPVQNQVGFTDITAFTVAGIVEYRDTSCPVPDAEVLVDGTLKTNTETDGTFSVSVDPSTDPADLRNIELRLNNPQDAADNHTFSPASVNLVADKDYFGLSFIDNKTRQLTLNFAGSCDTDIGTARIRIFTEDGCYDEEFEVSGLRTLELPPQKYLVQVLTVDTDSDLRADIITFFDNLGAQEMDLTQQADTLDLIYRAPIAVEISGLPELLTCPNNEITYFERDLPVVPILGEGETAELTISAYEDYGDSRCPVDEGTITIFDSIADQISNPPLEIKDGAVSWETQALVPNILAGASVEGIDRSFQKSITAIATVTGRPAVTATEWVIVEGIRPRTATFVSATTDPFPTMILHDPPGSNSYAYVEEGTTQCTRISSMQLFNGAGGAAADVTLGFRASTGLGFAVENGLGFKFNARTVFGEERSSMSTGVCPSVSGIVGGIGGTALGLGAALKIAISTSVLSAFITPAVAFAGAAAATLFYVPFAFAEDCNDGFDTNGDGVFNAWDKNIEICTTTTERWSTSSEEAWVGEDIFAGVALNLIFAEVDVLNVEQQDETCRVSLSEELGMDLDPKDAFATTYVYSSSHLEHSLIPALEDLQKQAGADQEFAGDEKEGINTVTLSETIDNWKNHLSLSEALTNLALNEDLNCAKLEKDGEDIKPVLDENGNPIPVECEEDLPFERINRSFSAGAEYEFSHNKETIQTIFAETARFHINNESDLGFIKTIGGFDQFAGATFAIDREWIEESTATETTSKTVGYVLSDNDHGDYFSVDIGTDPVFNTPVFRTRSGRSSNPWEPGWPAECRTLSDMTATGEPCTDLAKTQRRDNPVLSIFPPELHNVPPDQEGTLTLSLSNDSESQEQREYVLHIAKPENPNSLFMSITGDPIDGETFLIKPGQTQKIILQVARGQTPSFAYSYKDVAMYAYPEREYEIWQMDPRQPFVLSDTAFFSVYFDAPCSDINILEPKDLWSLNKTNSTLGVTLDGFNIPVSDSDNVAIVGLEYRLAGAGGAFGNSWQSRDALKINRGDLGDEATQWQIPDGWTPEHDGHYELRAFTECEIAGPGKRVYSPTISGTKDTVSPLVLGLPEPADDILSLGDAVAVTLSEDIDCGSVVTLLGSSAQNALLTYADGVEAGEDVPIIATCSGTTLSFQPDASTGTSWADFENRRLTMTLLGAGNAAGDNGSEVPPLNDLAGNPLPQQAVSSTVNEDVNWSFVVQRNALAWSPTNLPLGNATTVSSTLYNGRPTEVEFTLEDIPDYLVPSLDGATIPPGGQLTVDFAVDLSASFGALLPDTIRAASSTGDALLYLTCQDPTWNVNPAAYQYSMGITGRLFVGGVLSDDTGDMVAAFVGNQLRGVASVADMNGNLTPLTVYSNSGFGETVTFRIFDASECLTYPSATMTFTFNNGTTIGSEAQPVAFEGTFTLPQQQIDLAQGWTWFSLNRTAAEASPATVLGTVGATPGDVLKSQAAFSLYDDGAGWVGALAAITPGSAYQVKLAQASTLVLGGPKVRPDSTLTIMEGWNWLGYLPEVPLDITTAMGSTADTYTPSEGDMLKSQFSFETYSSGAWVPGTMVLTPGQGYMLMAGADAQFQYPGATTTTVETEPTVLAVRATETRAKAFAVEERAPDAPRKVVPGEDLPAEGHRPELAVDASAYQHSMTLIGHLTFDGEPLGDPRAEVWLTDTDGTVRGIAQPRYVEALGAHRLFLMLYSDAPIGEAYAVHVYDPATERTVTLDQYLAFKADHSAGSIAEPVAIAAETEGYKAAKAAEELPTEYALQQNYPNPFNPTTTIRYELPEASKVSLVVYDVLGREVLRLVDTEQAAGRYNVALDASRLASGVYLYRIEAGTFRQTRQMVLMK